MNLQRIQKMARILVLVNLGFFFAAATLGIKVVAAWRKPDIPGTDFIPKKTEITQADVMEKKKDAWHKFTTCYEARVLQPILKKTEVAKPVSLPVQSVVQAPIRIPFHWVGVIVHPTAQKSYAILLDERSQQQLLVRYGSLIPGTTYQVVEITDSKVSIQTGTSMVSIEKPKPVQPFNQSRKAMQKPTPSQEHPSDNTKPIVGDISKQALNLKK